jgi:drug/metabolite transporter (DMT)-like permease
MDICLAEMDPFTLNAYRFLGAFAVISIVAFPKLRSVNRVTMKYAAIIGLILTVVYATSTFGVKYTSQSNAGFLCAMAVVFTPILAFVFQRVVPDRKLILVVAMCFVGIALMSLNENLQVASGDILCLICSLAYAGDMLVVEHAVKRDDVNAFHLGVFQLLFTGLFMLVLSLIFGTPCLPQSGACWFGVIFLSVFCTGFCFIAQNLAQQYTSSTHVGVIFCLEPLFAGLVAFILAGEVLLPRAYFGACLLLAAMVLMEVDLPKLRKGGNG